MRKRLQYIVPLAVAGCAICALLTLLVTRQHEWEAVAHAGSPTWESLLVGNYSATTSSLLRSLNSNENSKTLEDTRRIAHTRESYAQDEAGRQQLALLKMEQQQKLLLEQRQLAEGQRALQEELDARAEEHITAMGGTDMTAGNEVYMGTPSQTPTVVHPTPTVTPVEDLTYYGQFGARFVCTCASCFDESEWPGVSAGDSFISADPEYLPAGVIVTLDQGSSGEFTVKDSDGSTTGRDIVVYNANHSEENGRQLLFPKIYRKIEET